MNPSGYTALPAAARFAQLETVKFLLQNKADVNVKTKSRYETTPLMESTRDGKVEIGRALLDAGAKVNTGDRHGDNALNWATYFGQTDFVKLLLERGADFTVTGQTDDTAIEIAIREKHEAIVKLLTEKGARPREKKK